MVTTEQSWTARIASLVGLVLLWFGGLSVPGSGAQAPGWSSPTGSPPSVGRGFDPPPVRWQSGHRGVDLVGAEGQPVVAAGGGVVAFAGAVAGKPVVSIQHPGGLRTTYEPVVASVSTGQSVTAGQPIGTLAAAHPGCPATACLHWGLRRGEQYLNPLLLLGGSRPVRLLPHR